ncbi:hypothetical protein BBD39_05130 [Arsenophonus endosymbiont of Bemisia tabaci Asia II 3]|nr:hypothetical protein BBD39_05130 [Arsenophonus endosymbiont of Bemisia tabaci Asia II 3]
MVRAMVSAVSSKAAPAKAQAGNNHLWLAPKLILIRCGTTKPIKPIIPLSATAQPIKSELSSNRIIFFFLLLNRDNGPLHHLIVIN